MLNAVLIQLTDNLKNKNLWNRLSAGDVSSGLRADVAAMEEVRGE